MEDDWGIDATAPTFSLFKTVSPEEEAMKDSFVDIVVYNRWKKAERRLYMKLKGERIAKLIVEQQLSTIDDLSVALESLNMLKSKAAEEDPMLDDLIGQLQDMHLKVSNSDVKNV